jgi:hypothetical protein
MDLTCDDLDIGLKRAAEDFHFIRRSYFIKTVNGKLGQANSFDGVYFAIFSWPPLGHQCFRNLV